MLQSIDAACQSTFTLGGVGSRRAQDGAPAWQDSRDGFVIQDHRLVLQDTPPTFHESDKLVVVMQDSFAYDRPDHCVEAGAVPPARQDANSHRSCHPQMD